MAKQSYGTCQLCGHRTSKGAMVRHIRKCSEEHDLGKGAAERLYHLRVEAQYAPVYWLDLDVKAKAELATLDQFLRNIWLECCGHMSAFLIDDHHYLEPYDKEFQIFDYERDMYVPLGQALRWGQTQMEYEYDFGTTTYLKLRVMGEREGRIGRQELRLLAQNEPLDWRCVECGEPAVAVCAMCIYEKEAIYCRKHARAHKCGEEYFLPVVNSPRMGECAYTGPEDWEGI